MAVFKRGGVWWYKFYFAGQFIRESSKSTSKTEGSQTEIKDTLAQDEHIKKMPVGQMEMLVTDPILGTIHKHLHIRKASSHWLPRVPMNVYPKLLTLASDTHGLNLSFPTPELEEKRQRRRKK